MEEKIIVTGGGEDDNYRTLIERSVGGGKLQNISGDGWRRGKTTQHSGDEWRRGKITEHFLRGVEERGNLQNILEMSGGEGKVQNIT